MGTQRIWYVPPGSTEPEKHGNGRRYEITQTTDRGAIWTFGWADTMAEAKTIAEALVTEYGLKGPLIRDRHTAFLRGIHEAGEFVHGLGRPNASSVMGKALVRLGLVKLRWFEPKKAPWARFSPDLVWYLVLTEKGQERVNKALKKTK